MVQRVELVHPQTCRGLVAEGHFEVVFADAIDIHILVHFLLHAAPSELGIAAAYAIAIGNLPDGIVDRGLGRISRRCCRRDRDRAAPCDVDPEVVPWTK